MPEQHIWKLRCGALLVACLAVVIGLTARGCQASKFTAPTFVVKVEDSGEKISKEKHGREKDTQRRDKFKFPKWGEIGAGVQNAPQAVIGFINSAGANINRGLNRVNAHAGKQLQSIRPGSFLERKVGVGTQNVHHDAETLRMVEHLNNLGLVHVLKIVEAPGWKHVTTKHGVTVTKRFLSAQEAESSGIVGAGVVDVLAAAKFAAVKAVGTLNAKAEDVYALFLSNDRVHEYNENCAEVKDLEYYSKQTKVTWARSPRMGPFKGRDFVTVVNYRTLPDGTLAVVNRPVNHSAAPAGDKHVRAEILIATNMMKPNANDPNKTDFISIVHINPGGIVDSGLGAQIMNALCAAAPVKLLKELEKAANSPPVPKRK